MKAVCFCYNDDTSGMDKFLDLVLISAVIGWSTVVFFDWSYWKTAPYQVHSLIAHGLVFALLFLRFCNGLDFGRVKRELKNPHRLIISFLAGINSVVATLVLMRVKSSYPNFLKLHYLFLFLVVIFGGYIQTLYFFIAIVRGFILGPSREQHQEMNEEEEKADN